MKIEDRGVIIEKIAQHYIRHGRSGVFKQIEMVRWIASDEELWEDMLSCSVEIIEPDNKRKKMIHSTPNQHCYPRERGMGFSKNGCTHSVRQPGPDGDGAGDSHGVHYADEVGNFWD